VADPGVDLGGVDTVNEGLGGGRESLKVLTVEVKVISLECFGHISIKIRLYMNRERRQEKFCSV